MYAKKNSSSQRQGFFKRLRARLNRGDSWLTYDLAKLAPGGKIDEDVLEELESLLVMADVGWRARSSRTSTRCARACERHCYPFSSPLPSRLKSAHRGRSSS